jgi:hypothetical protein
MHSCSTLVLRLGRSSDTPRYCTTPPNLRYSTARSGDIEHDYVPPQVINAVAIRHQRPFRAATAGDDNLIVFHQGKCCYFVRLRHSFSIQYPQGLHTGTKRQGKS